MEHFIQVRIVPLRQLFSDYLFQLPWFQRAYAWSDQHAGRLITDVVDAMKSPQKRYWLGHIFLATGPNAQRASIVDGHQRTVTVTMICALLRDMAPDGPEKSQLHKIVGSNTEDGWRLQLQPSVSPFFEQWVQGPDQTLKDPTGDVLDLSEGERHLLNNRDHLRSMLRSLVPTPQAQKELTDFLLENCLVTVETVEDETEAWTLLATAEETGLEFHSSERAKVSLITAMPRNEQEEASHLFEQALAAVGPDCMTNLLGHIKRLKVRRRSSKPVERELLERFELNVSGLTFMRETLVPAAEKLAQINRRNIGTGEQRDANKHALTTLFWLDHQLWMPAVLHWLETMGDDHPECTQFLKNLDRLTYILKIAGIDPTVQERRYIQLLNEIDEKPPVDSIETLKIEPPLRRSALDVLRSRTFYSKRFHALILRRISWSLSPERDPGPVDGKTVTVEHILPRRPPAGRTWHADFESPEKVANYCNRLGNLAFLSLNENHHAGTNDYIVKRLLLAQSASRFVLAERAAKYEKWNAEVILERTELLIKDLFTPWQLSVSD